MRNAVDPVSADRMALQQLDQSSLLRQLQQEDDRVPSPPFNMFTLTHKAHREVMHSDILAFLLDTQREHGLGNRFAQALLTAVLPATNWAHCRFEAQREPQHIDVLLRDPVAKRLIIIENKINAPEHGNQLQTYWQSMVKTYKDWRIDAIFLTPKGTFPSFDRYVPMSYQQVYGVLQDLLANPGALSHDTAFLLRHYADLLRSKIMESDPHISQLCRDIYRKHRRAIDLITAQQNNFQRYRFDMIHRLVLEQQHELKLDITYLNPDEGIFDFIVQDWPTELTQQTRERATNCLFEVSVSQSGHTMLLRLYVHADAQHIQQAYINPVQLNGITLQLQAFNAKWSLLWSQDLLAEDDVAVLDDASEKALITTRWQHFVDHQLPEINTHLKTRYGSQSKRQKR